MQLPDFNNTEIAFRYKTTSELKRAHFLFSVFKYNIVVKWGPAIMTFALKSRLPVKGIIKQFGFRHFCGGETMDECDATAKKLHAFGVGSILDYAAEGKGNAAELEFNKNQILKTIDKTAGNAMYPFAVFKPTGILSFEIMEKADSGVPLTNDDLNVFYEGKARVEAICQRATQKKVPLFIDAEDSWIQKTVDSLVEEMMEKHNHTEVIVYNTLQMYRHDRLKFLEAQILKAKEKGYKLGFKLVRGAYMEKERERAEKMGYLSPIHKDKAATDADYDAALSLCVENADIVSICCGSHNEDSSELLVKLMNEKGFANNDKRFWFAQLFGMSDHISFNLSQAGYNVAKYLPFGPIKTVLPYLSRRAQENTSVAGQASRELVLIKRELKRRKA